MQAMPAAQTAAAAALQQGQVLPVAHTAAAGLQCTTAWTAVDVAVKAHSADGRWQPLTPLLLPWSEPAHTLLLLLHPRHEGLPL